jgi:hypothetical protein
MNRIVLSALMLMSAQGLAQAPAADTTPDNGATAPAPNPNPTAQAVSVLDATKPIQDETGGAYTSPTLLFIPAAALPPWTVRVITSLDMQGPTGADRLASGTSIGFQPGIGGELGLPAGFTVGAGTQWVGGDTSPAPIGDGISPYLQVRYNIYGDKVTGQGLQLGTSLTYKFVGFEGDPGEMELAFSAQYRHSKFELGLQAVFGKDFATVDADAEGHAYAVYRLIPQLALGAAVQYRKAAYFFGPAQPGDTTYDVISGGIVSYTTGRWQLGALIGESTVGLNQGQAGGLGELFGSARF